MRLESILGARLNGVEATEMRQGGQVVWPLGASGGWDISNASYDGVSFYVGNQELGPFGLTWGADGTKVYVTGTVEDKVHQYAVTALGEPWDLSAVAHEASFSVAAQEATPTGVAFNTDGTRMFVIGDTNNRVYQYDLGTAWDVNTAVYNGVSFNTSSGISGAVPSLHSLFFKGDGTRMYVVDTNNDQAHQYSLSTGWDVSTASYDGVSVGVSDGSPHGVALSEDGAKLFVIGDATDHIYQYTLGTAWDIGTAVGDGVSYDCSAQEDLVSGLAFKPDGTKMYVVGRRNDRVYQYSL